MKRSPTATRVDVTGSLPDLTKRPTVYIDIDDTIIACIWDGSGFDLRPNIMTQLRVLKELYNVRWLTCWPYELLEELFKSLYGQDIWRDTQYEDWRASMHRGKGEKVDAVLEGPENWYWLEDPLYSTDLIRLQEAKMMHRYIKVEPRGAWAFADACKRLFSYTGVTPEKLVEIGADMKWFERY